jgi:hypothetical protein
MAHQLAEGRERKFKLRHIAICKVTRLHIRMAPATQLWSALSMRYGYMARAPLGAAIKQRQV